MQANKSRDFPLTLYGDEKISEVKLQNYNMFRMVLAKVYSYIFTYSKSSN
jgi:hypothetical protein